SHSSGLLVTPSTVLAISNSNYARQAKAMYSGLAAHMSFNPGASGDRSPARPQISPGRGARPTGNACRRGLDPPDFRTISDFRKRHLRALAALFLQVLKLCEKAGLVKLGHVALDGTKIKANASKHKAMSYERMKKREAELQAEVDRMLAAAEAADAQEDETHGKTKTGDEMPNWVADKQKRIEKIREAQAALEAEAKQ